MHACVSAICLVAVTGVQICLVTACNHDCVKEEWSAVIAFVWGGSEGVSGTEIFLLTVCMIWTHCLDSAKHLQLDRKLQNRLHECQIKNGQHTHSFLGLTGADTGTLCGGGVEQ